MPLSKQTFVDAENGLLAPTSLQPESERVAHNVFMPQFPYTSQKIRMRMIQVVRWNCRIICYFMVQERTITS